MTHTDLDDKIRTLERSIPDKPAFFQGHRDRIDWRSLFNLAKEIQAGFNSKVRYPSRDDQQAAWARFNEARSKLRSSSDADREHRRSRSESWLKEILRLVGSATVPGAVDNLLLAASGIGIALMGTSKEEMIEKGRKLREAGRLLSEKKHEMIREHKDEAFTRIQEVQRDHNEWWGRYNAAKEERRKEKQQRQREWRDRTVEKLHATERNLESNTERYEKAARALGHVRSNLAKNEAKLADTSSEKWEGIIQGWIEEEEAKASDIEARMERIQGWMEDDRARIAELRAKLEG